VSRLNGGLGWLALTLLGGVIGILAGHVLASSVL
jgi:hypothetical protein